MKFRFFDNTHPPYYGPGREPVLEVESSKGAVAEAMDEADLEYQRVTGKDWRKSSMVSCVIVR